MAYHIEGLGFPGLTTPLTTRLHEYVLRLMAGVKNRDEVKAALPLAPGERILTSVCDSRGLCVAASERALYYQSADRSERSDWPGWVRIGWEAIGKVDWNDRQETLTLTGLLPTVARRTVLHIAQGSSLGMLARDRVAWTAVVSTEMQVGAYGRARVIGRRVPGSDELTWLVGIDGARDAPDFRIALEGALSALRTRLGV